MNTILEKINQASLKLLEPLSPEQMYKTIVDEAIILSSNDEGLIILKYGDDLKTVYGSSELASSVRPRKRGYAYTALTKKKVLFLNSKEMLSHDAYSVQKGIKSWLFVPLSYKNTSIGVLVLRSYKNDKKLNVEDLKVWELFGSLASLAVKKTQLYDETKKALEIRDLFISLASHELRTPLTSINGYIQLLYNKLGKQDTSEGKWIRELSDESQRLTNLVKELLEINRIKQGQFHFSFIELNFNTVIEKTIERLQLINPERDISYVNKIGGNNDLLIGDPDKLLQMTTAIIENALKFSPPGVKIEVILSDTKKHLLLVIKDKGVGIKNDDLERVLEGFYKGTQQEKEGIGVGLTMARHIIQAHHGEIKIKSKEKKGTEVTIKLPKGKI